MRQRESAVLLAVVSVSAGLSSQQTVVVPPSHATAEGTGSTNVPFGRATPVRVQAAYSGQAVGVSGSIARLDYRLDGGVTMRSKKVEFELRLSTMPRGVTAVQARFADNRGRDEVVARRRGIVDLPARSGTAGPQAFHIVLPLDQPFRYDHRAGPLLVETTVFAQQPGAATLDSTWACQSPSASVGPAGCGPQTPLQLELMTRQVMWGRPLSLRIRSAPVGGATILMLGTRSTGTWHGERLPIDLTRFGAPGCHLSIDVAASQQSMANGSGVAEFRLIVPSDPALRLGWIHAQGVAADPRANALGVTTAQAMRVQVCGWEPVARVFAGGFTATEGVRELGVAPVLQVTVR